MPSGPGWPPGQAAQRWLPEGRGFHLVTGLSRGKNVSDFQRSTPGVPQHTTHSHAHAHPSIHARTHVHGSLWSLHYSLGISTFNAASAGQPGGEPLGSRLVLKQTSSPPKEPPVTRLVRSPVVCGRRSQVWHSGLWARQVQGRRGRLPRIKSDGVRWRRGGSACPAVGWGGETSGLGDSPAVWSLLFLCPREQPLTVRCSIICL